jgi:hypothetical protein
MLTQASALVVQRRAVYATDGSLPGELASAAFAAAAKLLRGEGHPFRDQRLAKAARFAQLEADRVLAARAGVHPGGGGMSLFLIAAVRLDFCFNPDGTYTSGVPRAPEMRRAR